MTACARPHLTRTVASLLLTALAAGCGASEQPPSAPPHPSRSQPSRSQPSRSQPSTSQPSRSQPAAPAAPARSDPPPGTIVIKGSQTASPDRATQDAEDRARIAELERRARASQGQPAPAPTQPPRVTKPAEPDPRALELQQLEQALAALTERIAALQAEKDELIQERRVRRARRRVTTEVDTNPERTAEIDAELTRLTNEKQELEQRQATLGR